MTYHHDHEAAVYPDTLVRYAREPKYFGRLNDPTSSAWIKGACGDQIEFYLVITNDRIDDIRFFTQGCISTIVCGSMTAELAKGKSIYDALSISPKQVMDALQGLPKESTHCTILAVSTLYKAIADYLLKP